MDCIHDLGECAECGGLKVTTYTSLGSAGAITLDGVEIGTGEVYIAPLNEPCPSPPNKET